MNANLSPTTKTWLAHATSELKSAGISTAELDSLVLLEDCLSVPRANILAHPETKLTIALTKKLDAQILRRKTHEPLAYIRGITEFYGREFIVNRYTLEPRPETETMIELLKKYAERNVRIADIGTGSGAIAVTVKLELPETQVIATDVSDKCLEITGLNSKNYSANIQCFQGDLLEPLVDQKINSLLCNLPYVPDDFGINKAALHEPKIAIFGGRDGLDLYRKLFQQIKARTQKPRYILTESLPTHHKKLAVIADQSGYKQIESEDFIQVFELERL